LTQLNLAKEMGLPYLYLGYWIADSGKMAYKRRFQPIEALVDGHWKRLFDVAGERGEIVNERVDVVEAMRGYGR